MDSRTGPLDARRVADGNRVLMGKEVKLHVGCCGFPMAHAAYYKRFPVIEVQQTFYQPPRIATLDRWRAEAPEGFQFTLKAWQLITHEPSSPNYRRLRMPIPTGKRERYGAFRPTPEVFAAWESTLACARALQARIVVFQSPASFTPTPHHLENLHGFFAKLRNTPHGPTLAWEPRGWPLEQAAAVCQELELVRVVDPFEDTPPETGLRYFRLHGLTGYGYQYSDPDLERLRASCRGTTYCLFNNASMVEDASRFLARAGASDFVSPVYRG
jgi:uncharacterized protein YecE (DUF72 family)